LCDQRFIGNVQAWVKPYSAGNLATLFYDQPFPTWNHTQGQMA